MAKNGGGLTAPQHASFSNISLKRFYPQSCDFKPEFYPGIPGSTFTWFKLHGKSQSHIAPFYDYQKGQISISISHVFLMQGGRVNT